MTKKEPDSKQEARDQLAGEIDAMFDRHIARWKDKLPSDVVVILFQTILLQKAVLSAVLTGQTKETILQVAGDYCDRSRGKVAVDVRRDCKADTKESRF
jgi:hypothetical protein